VAPNSSIKTFDDIRGKTILTIAGSDVHVMLLIMLRSRFGTDDLRQLGITLRGINAVTELWIQQPGVDVTIGFPPGSLDAEYAGQFRTLIYNNGRTGPAYDGPEGRGEGHQLSWFRNSPFYPEAFFPPRIWWAVREEFLNQNPQIVTAFLAAQQRAAAFIKQAGAQYAVGLIGEHWAGSVRAKLREVETILWFKRGWVWITEGDARALIGLSQVRQIFENPLDGARIKGLMGRAADVTRRAYEIAGRIPDTPVFTDPNATDQRVASHAGLLLGCVFARAPQGRHYRGDEHDCCKRQQRCSDRPLDEGGDVAARQDQRTAQMLLHHRPEHEAEDQGSRLTVELQEQIAERPEQRRETDFESGTVERVHPDAAEKQDRGKQEAIRDR
jgi:hypothetical protein